MLTSEWKEVSAISNLGEDDDRVVGHIVNGSVEVAYLAYGGLKIASLTGVKDIPDVSSGIPNVSEFSGLGDDWEVGINAVVEIDGAAQICYLAIDSCDCLSCVNHPETEGKLDVDTCEYDSDDFDELDQDLIEFFDLK